MGAEVLSSRAIQGMFYARLAQNVGASWVPLISNYFTSDQSEEEYAWLGMPPAMREWIGGRQAKDLRDDSLTIKNKVFEATLRFRLEDLRRDKTGQVQVRINELVERTQAHWASMLSTLIANGSTGVCYDGQYFFDTNHSEGDSGTQSNKISVDISALPTTVHGSTTAPSPEEAAQAAIQGITQICTLKDDQGEPMNETANQFLVMVPPSLYHATRSGLTLPRGTDVAEQVADKEIIVAMNTRLSTWTDKMAVFRTDSAIKALIRQEEQGVRMSSKAEGSEFEHDFRMHEHGVAADRNVGYGRWQYACQVTLA